MLYVAGELEPAQVASLEARLSSDAAMREQLADFQGVDARLRSVRSESVATGYLSDRALKSSLRLVREQVLLANQAASIRPVFRVPPYAIAAGIAILFTLGFISWLYTTPPVSNTPAPAGGLARSPGGGPANQFGGFAGLTAAFSPVGVEQYGEASQQIDLELDALSMLSDFEEGDPN